MDDLEPKSTAVNKHKKFQAGFEDHVDYETGWELRRHLGNKPRSQQEQQEREAIRAHYEDAFDWVKHVKYEKATRLSKTARKLLESLTDGERMLRELFYQGKTTVMKLTSKNTVQSESALNKAKKVQNEHEEMKQERKGRDYGFLLE